MLLVFPVYSATYDALAVVVAAIVVDVVVIAVVVVVVIVVVAVDVVVIVDVEVVEGVVVDRSAQMQLPAKQYPTFEAQAAPMHRVNNSWSTHESTNSPLGDVVVVKKLVVLVVEGHPKPSRRSIGVVVWKLVHRFSVVDQPQSPSHCRTHKYS